MYVCMYVCMYIYIYIYIKQWVTCPPVCRETRSDRRGGAATEGHKEPTSGAALSDTRENGTCAC